jgi:hypothetical protein
MDSGLICGSHSVGGCAVGACVGESSELHADKVLSSELVSGKASACRIRDEY